MFYEKLTQEEGEGEKIKNRVRISRPFSADDIRLNRVNFLLHFWTFNLGQREAKV